MLSFILSLFGSPSIAGALTNGHELTALRDPGMFTTETLSQFDGVMFALNTEEGQRLPAVWRRC